LRQEGADGCGGKAEMTGKGLGLTTPSKAKAAIWQQSWFKVYGVKNMTDIAICTLCVKKEAWTSCEMGYGKSRTPTNRINHFNGSA